MTMAKEGDNKTKVTFPPGTGGDRPEKLARHCYNLFISRKPRLPTFVIFGVLELFSSLILYDQKMSGCSLRHRLALTT